MALTKIKLLGKLGKKYGRNFTFDINTPIDAIRLMRVNFPDFDQYLVDTHESGVGYRFVVEGKDQDEATLTTPFAEGVTTLVIAPAVYGSGGAAFRIIAGVALIGIGLFSGFTPLALLGGALVLGGISQLLSPTPKNNEDNPSEFFSGPVNTVNQGNPVPLCYGRLITGSHVISAGISLDKIAPANPCNAQLTAGGYSWPTPDTKVIGLGTGTGTVTLTYDAKTVPDRFVVKWDGQVVIDTGYRGAPEYDDDLAAMGLPPTQGLGQGTATFVKSKVYPETATVEVYGPFASTGWDYTLGCPS